LQEKYGDQGLSILAVTSEGASETEKFVAKNEMQYAYAYDKGGKLARHFGVTGIPHAVLIDASGTVVWKGHPGMLEPGEISRATSGALKKPLFDWPSEARTVRSALQKGAYKAAIDAAAGLGPDADGDSIRSTLQAMVASKVASLKDAREMGDFLGAEELAKTFAKELSGLPEADEVARIAAEVGADDNAQSVIKGQKKIAKIRDKGPSKKKDIERAIDDLRKLKKEYAGTYVETEAEALIKQLGSSKG